MEKWYQLPPEQVAETLGTNLAGGLSKKEAASRLERTAVYHIPRMPFSEAVGAVLTDLSTILLIVTVLLAAAFDLQKEAIGIAVVLMVSLSLQVAVLMVSHRILEGLGEYSVPQSRVVRGGKVYLIDSRRVVRGDIVLLTAGDIVPADLRLLGAEDFRVVESRVTGEGTVVLKNPSVVPRAGALPKLQDNMVFATDTVVSGRARAVAVRCGQDTLYCTQNGPMTLTSHGRLAFLDEIRQFCRKWGLCMVAAAFVITLLTAVFAGGSPSHRRLFRGLR